MTARYTHVPEHYILDCDSLEDLDALPCPKCDVVLVRSPMAQKSESLGHFHVTCPRCGMVFAGHVQIVEK